MGTFKDRLRSLRKGRDLTQEQLAVAISSSKQAISQYERGIRRPEFDVLTALCDFFNVSSDYILGISDITMRFLGSDELDLLDSFSRKHNDLIECFNSLNQEGQEKVISYAKDLAASGLYNICDKSKLSKKEA